MGFLVLPDHPRILVAGEICHLMTGEPADFEEGIRRAESAICTARAITIEAHSDYNDFSARAVEASIQKAQRYINWASYR